MTPVARRRASRSRTLNAAVPTTRGRREAAARALFLLIVGHEYDGEIVADIDSMRQIRARIDDRPIHLSRIESFTIIRRNRKDAAVLGV